MKNKDQKVSRREVLELINRSVGLREKSFFLSEKMFSTIEKLQKSISGIIFLIIFFIGVYFYGIQ